MRQQKTLHYMNDRLSHHLPTQPRTHIPTDYSHPFKQSPKHLAGHVCLTHLTHPHPAAHHMTQRGGRAYDITPENECSSVLKFSSLYLAMYDASFVPKHKHTCGSSRHACTQSHRAPQYWHSVDRECGQLLSVFFSGYFQGHRGNPGLQSTLW